MKYQKFDAEKKKKLLSLTAEKMKALRQMRASKDFDEIFNAKNWNWHYSIADILIIRQAQNKRLLICFT